MSAQLTSRDSASGQIAENRSDGLALARKLVEEGQILSEQVTFASSLRDFRDTFSRSGFEIPSNISPAMESLGIRSADNSIKNGLPLTHPSFDGSNCVVLMPGGVSKNLERLGSAIDETGANVASTPSDSQRFNRFVLNHELEHCNLPVEDRPSLGTQRLMERREARADARAALLERMQSHKDGELDQGDAWLNKWIKFRDSNSSVDPEHQGGAQAVRNVLKIPVEDLQKLNTAGPASVEFKAMIDRIQSSV